MGATASASEEAMRKRQAAKMTNYSLSKLLQHDDISHPTAADLAKHKVLYLCVDDSLASLEAFFGFLARYHHHPIMLHSLIVRQIKYIIQALQILTDYDTKLTKINHKQSIFYCRQSYSAKWIMSTHHVNVELKYEEGKKILKVWNDISTQTLMLLIQKYQNKDTINMSKDIDDKSYFNHIKPYLEREYPIDIQFCQYFMVNILKFCFNEMTIETHLERKLFLKCLTNNGKFPLTKQELTINGHKLSVCCHGI